MIYLKRFLYILLVSVLCTLGMVLATLYVGLIPLGMIISFILTGDFTKYFIFGLNVGDYTISINNKLERIFLNN
jgi:hypothetical protein